MMGPDADRTVQLGHGFHLVAQGRDLTDHVHALLLLAAKGNIAESLADPARS